MRLGATTAARLAVAVLTISLVATACGDDDDDVAQDASPTSADTTASPDTTAPAGAGASDTTTAEQPAAGDAVDLASACPNPVVIQTDWYATPERAAAYQLAGPDAEIDASNGSVTGPLGDTGIDVEVRLGGPFIGFQPIPSLMYQDDSIYLGYVATDEAVAAAADFPTTAVVAPLDLNPQILMWDPERYTIASFEDVAATGAPVVYLEGLPFMDHLVAQGYVDDGQLDASFDGTPARFVAEQGAIIQQGYASNEPYRWEHDVEGWQKPVEYLLIHDAGYEIYPQGLAVRSDELADDAACLAGLVPLVQQAQVDYVTDPGPVNDLLVRIAEELGEGPPITADANADAVTVMLDLGLVGNGPDGTLGNFDDARVDAMIALLQGIFADRGQDVPADLASGDIVTNEFVDPSIGL